MQLCGVLFFGSFLVHSMKDKESVISNLLQWSKFITTFILIPQSAGVLKIPIS